MSEKKNSSLPPSKTSGPVVKTGPTAGQNRSRNDDGRWRAKRSDSGKSRDKKSGGCFLTTAACEHKSMADNCVELQTLRRFRDEYLLSTVEGSQLVERYYDIAPTIAQNLTSEQADHVWQVVQICIEQIKSKNFDTAICIYQSMVEGLTQKQY